MLEEVVLFPALMLLIGWALWLWTRKTQMRHRERLKQLELQHELAKKFSSSPEFITFVQSEEGKRIFTNHESGVHFKIIRYVSGALLLVLIGVAMIINAYSYRFETDSNYVSKAQDFYYWGSLAVAIGIGFAVNAYVTVWLGKKWNLFGDRK